MFAVIKRFCFCVLPFLYSILHWTNVPKWKWILAHKTDDVKALEWNSHQESTIWYIGLPLTEVSINIRALHSMELKARLYWIVSVLARYYYIIIWDVAVERNIYMSLYFTLPFMQLSFNYYFYYYYSLILLYIDLAFIKSILIILHVLWFYSILF